METDYEITNDQTGTVLKTDITCPNVRFKRVIGHLNCSSRLNCCEDIPFKNDFNITDGGQKHKSSKLAIFSVHLLK